nr:hypothetical protein [Zoogloeaceae bacterium]
MITIRCKDPVLQSFLAAAAIAFALAANVVSTLPEDDGPTVVVSSDEYPRHE